MKKTALFLAIMIVFLSHLSAQKSEVFIKNGYAINGYDVVAFSADNKEVKGSKEYKYSWNNAEWLFANQQHLDSFKLNPEKYAPQYGGYCAYGTADGHKAPTDADTWTIVNDKLYFNYNSNVKKMWIKDQPALITKADANWEKIKDKE